MRYKNISIFKKIYYTLMTAIAVFIVGAAINLSSIVSHAECTGKITATTCNIRSDASTTSNAIGSKSNGDSITIVGQKTGADGYVWYEIYVNATTTGYVRSDLATITSGTIGDSGSETGIDDTINAVNPVTGTVSGGQAVRVRADASTSSTIVSSAPSGTSLTVNGTKTGTDNREWYYVEYLGTDGKTVKGFIRSDFIDLGGATLSPLSAETDTPDTTPTTGSESGETSTPSTTEDTSKPYETKSENGTWYLLDYAGNAKYDIVQITDIIKQYESGEIVAKKNAKGGSAKTVWLIIFIVLAIAGIAAAAYFYLKLRENSDRSAFADAEKERKARANGAQKSSSGASRPNGGQRPSGTSRPAGSGATRPAGARPAGAPGARPAGAPGARPAGAPGARPAGAPGARPAGAPGARPAGAPAPRPVQSDMTVRAIPQPSAKTAVDDDDEFEFGFLNWDGDDKK